MSFLKFIIFMLVLIGGGYWKTTSNETKVYNYFKQYQCENIVLHRNEYKAVCKEMVMLIPDFIFMDLDSRSEILYKDISSVERMGNHIILHNKELELKVAEPRVYFASDEEAAVFGKAIRAKLK